jgi:hypothetical protein
VWIAEAVLIVTGFAIGMWMPTDHSDAFAIRRGIQEQNQRRRATIQRAEADYRLRYPRAGLVYNGSIVCFALGFTIVMISGIHAGSESSNHYQDLGIVVGFSVQVLAWALFLACSLSMRRTLVKALREDR